MRRRQATSIALYGSAGLALFAASAITVSLLVGRHSSHQSAALTPTAGLEAPSAFDSSPAASRPPVGLGGAVATTSPVAGVLAATGVPSPVRGIASPTNPAVPHASVGIARPSGTGRATRSVTASPADAAGSASGQPDTGAATASSACGLLTPAEAAAALGATTTAQETTEPGPVGGTSCTWSTATSPLEVATFLLQRPADITAPGTTPASFFAEEVAGARTHGDLTPVPGVGDQAYLSTKADTLSSAQVYVLKGQSALTGYIPLGSDVSSATLRDLAALAAQRL